MTMKLETRMKDGKPCTSKWRENHRPGLCTRFDCRARDVRCEQCIRFSEYAPPKGAA